MPIQKQAESDFVKSNCHLCGAMVPENRKVQVRVGDNLDRVGNPICESCELAINEDNAKGALEDRTLDSWEDQETVKSISKKLGASENVMRVIFNRLVAKQEIRDTKMRDENNFKIYVRETDHWGTDLINWLLARGYQKTEHTYSHECEFQKTHVRVRINSPAGIIVLRDPNATIQVAAGNLIWSPNAWRIDYAKNPIYNRNLLGMQESIIAFENKPALTRESALKILEKRC